MTMASLAWSKVWASRDFTTEYRETAENADE